MTDVQDSPNFLSCFGKDGVFKGDARGMLVQLSCDGVNRFDDKTVQYSMWPVVLSMLNMPSSIRHLYSNFMLVSIIPHEARLKASRSGVYNCVHQTQVN